MDHNFHSRFPPPPPPCPPLPGTYQCRAENSEDSSDASALLEVLRPPRLTRRPSDAAAAARADVELRCAADGVPDPRVQWYKNGDLIVESEYFQVGGVAMVAVAVVVVAVSVGVNVVVVVALVAVHCCVVL